MTVQLERWLEQCGSLGQWDGQLVVQYFSVLRNKRCGTRDIKKTGAVMNCSTPCQYFIVIFFRYSLFINSRSVHIINFSFWRVGCPFKKRGQKRGRLEKGLSSITILRMGYSDWPLRLFHGEESDRSNIENACVVSDCVSSGQKERQKKRSP